MRSNYRLGLAAVGAILVVAFLGGGALADASSSWVTYFGPVQRDGEAQCAQNKAVMQTNPDYATSHNDARNGGMCGQNNTVPSGWLGTQAHLVRGDGFICETAAWVFNPSPTYAIALSLGFPASNCTKDGSFYKAESHAQYWDDLTNVYVKSDWLSSPYQQVP